MKWRTSPLKAAGWSVGLALNAWLLVVVAGEIWSDDAADVDNVEWRLDLSAPVATSVSRRPIDAYRQILAHPLFFKSREPFVPPPPRPVPPLAPPTIAVVDPGLVLGGIMIKDDVRKAYVFTKTGTAGAWTSEGEKFLGWKVTSINGAGTTLEQKGHTIDLQLYPRD